jgi:AcrR family transcriptional regulator
MTTQSTKRRLPASERRALIVGAALEEFAAHGYEGASLRRIGHAAGVSRTVLYDHFASKRELFAGLLEEKHRDLLTHLGEALVGDAPMDERMNATLDAFFAFAEREPQACQLLFPEHAPVDPVAAADHRRHRAEANRILAAMLEPDARRTGIDPASAVGEAMFAQYIAALHGAVRWWYAHPHAAREDVVASSMNLLWTGLGGLERLSRVRAAGWVPGEG